MDISILGYKLNVELLILIGVVYLILVGHTLGSCCSCNMGSMEGLINMDHRKNTMMPTQVGAGAKKEGFVGANTNFGESSQYSLGGNGGNSKINTDSWSAPNLTVVPGQPLSAGVTAILNRPAQPIPLPEGEMLMFADTPFKPECCPNSFSTSTGCACMTSDQYNYLVTRGGNNVPYSEY